MHKKNKTTISWAKPNIGNNAEKYVLSALRSNWISGGEYISKLENSFSKLFNSKHALLTSNGTSAIHLSYLSLGLKKGDEIIIPGFAFLGAANIAMQMGLKPVFAEVNPETWCLDAKSIEKKITKKTKVIVPVHTYGNVCEMDEIMQLAKSYNLNVIEDCAESLFSKYKDQYCGTFSQISTFSFQATKTITTGEGGLVVTNNSDLFQKMKLYHSHGLKERGTYYHHVPGHNFRLTNIQAALGFAQFKQKNKIIRKREELFKKYRVFFNQNGFRLQEFTPSVVPVWWAFAIKLDPQSFPKGRNWVIQKLYEKNIETRPGFLASSLLGIYKPHTVPVCEELSRQVISLPSYVDLSNEDMERICREIMKLKK